VAGAFPVVIHWISVKSCIDAGPDRPQPLSFIPPSCSCGSSASLVVDLHDAGVDPPREREPALVVAGHQAGVEPVPSRVRDGDRLVGVADGLGRGTVTLPRLGPVRTHEPVLKLARKIDNGTARIAPTSWEHGIEQVRHSGDHIELPLPRPRVTGCPTTSGARKRRTPPRRQKPAAPCNTVIIYCMD
jgi:hypothetical protein